MFADGMQDVRMDMSEAEQRFDTVSHQERQNRSMTEPLEDLQQTAYARGQAIKQRHRRQRCVLQGTKVSMLASDFAHAHLYRELQNWQVPDTHTRIAACAKAFEDGYQQG